MAQDRAAPATHILLRYLPNQNLTGAMRVVVAVASAVLAALLRAALPIDQAPFLLFIPAVLATSLWLGFMAGLVTLLTSLLLGTALFVGSPFSFAMSASQIGRTILFTLVSLSLAAVASLIRDTVLRLHHELDRTRELEAQTLDSQRERAGAQALHRSLFNAIDAGFCIVEVAVDDQDRALDYRFIEVNPAFEQQTGLKDVEGRWMHDLAPDHPQSWFDVYGEVASSGEPRRFESPGSASEGRWYEVHAFRVGEASERHVAVLFTDVTTRRQDQAAVLESEARFRLIADSAPVPIWVTRADRKREFVNRAYEEFLGLPYAEALEFDWREVLHPDDVARIRAEQIEKEGALEVFALEARYRSAAGEWRWLRSLSQPRRDALGAFNGFIGVAYDVTLAKEAAQRLAEVNATLETRVGERTRERDRLWELSADLLILADAEGGVLRASPSAIRLFGELEGNASVRAVAELIHPDDLATLGTAMAAMRRRSQPESVELRMRSADGAWRWIDWTLSPEPDGQRFSGVGRDVTVARERQAELEVMQQSLRQSQKLEAVGQLTGGIAHDFNNLLTIMRSSIDFLRREDLAEARRQRYVAAISETVDRASRLTGQLLAFARRQPLRPQTFGVSGRVERIAELVRPVVGARIRVEVRRSEPEAFAEADIAEFEAALVNLAVNARDAMDGEGELTITVRAGATPAAAPGLDPRSGSLIAVSVEDTGPGIAPEVRERIFEPFFTTKDVGKGTGLGLSQVFGFVKQSGGEVEVGEAIGGGAKFTLYLPQALQPPSPGPPTERTAIPPGSGRILVVEDDPHVGQFSTDILQDLGYSTRWVMSGQEALRLLDGEAPPFDLVFSDVIMPGMTGLELSDTLAVRHPSLPVILTTGYSQSLAQEGTHGRELVRKPFSAGELAEACGKVLGAQRLGPTSQ